MIVVVGAGLTGLCLSRALKSAGAEHVVLEGLDRTGGVIRSVMRDGVVLEEGPQRLRATPALRALIRDAGLAGDVIEAPSDLPLFIQRDGRLHLAPLRVRDLLRTDLLSLAAKARLLLEPFTAPAREDETVGAYFTRRTGRAAYEDVLGPLFGGLFASDPANMLVRHALAPFLRAMHAERSMLLAWLTRSRRPAPPCSFRAGMQSLTDALHARVREHVRTSTPVRTLRARPDGYEVLTDATTIIADAVVLTCPADAAAVILADVAPDAAARLASLAYNPLAVVHLRSDAHLYGLGWQASLRESSVARGMTYNASLFGESRRGVSTAFMGGARAPGALEKSDVELGDIAARAFSAVTGAVAEPVHVARTRVPAWDLSWRALDGLSLPRGIHLCANYESRIGLAGRVMAAQRVAARLIA